LADAELYRFQEKGVSALCEARMDVDCGPRGSGGAPAQGERQTFGSVQMDHIRGLVVSCCHLFLYLFFISANVVKVWPEAGTNCRGS